MLQVAEPGNKTTLLVDMEPAYWSMLEPSEHQELRCLAATVCLLVWQLLQSGVGLRKYGIGGPGLNIVS